MGKHGPAAPNTDTYSHAYAEPNSIDLADSFRVAVRESLFQRDALALATTINPPDIRLSHADAERVAGLGR